MNRAITRPATITKTFTQTYPSYMQSFIKIRGAVLEKSAVKIMTLCNFNKDIKVNNQCRKGDEPVQFFFEGTVFMARCSRKPAQLSSHSELAANRIIQALVTLCTWQKYEDS